MRKPHGYWTHARCATEAARYTLRKTFKNTSSSAYDKSKLLGILDDVCAHMTPVPNKWSPATLAAEAMKYQHRSDFECGSRGAYRGAIRRGILDDVCAHMTLKTARFENDQPCNLYYLRVNTDAGPLYKIGITVNSYKRRYANVAADKLQLLRRWRFATGKAALDAEQAIIRHCADHAYTGPNVLPQGNTELFTADILGLGCIG